MSFGLVIEAWIREEIHNAGDWYEAREAGVGGHFVSRANRRGRTPRRTLEPQPQKRDSVGAGSCRTAGETKKSEMRRQVVFNLDALRASPGLQYFRDNLAGEKLCLRTQTGAVN
jgi:hypothetical protein